MSNVETGMHGGQFVTDHDCTTYSPSEQVQQDMQCRWRFWRRGKAIRKMEQELNEYWGKVYVQVTPHAD